MEDQDLSFAQLVDAHGLEHQEGNLFSYLIRVMNLANKLAEASKLTEFETLAERVRKTLARVDLRFAFASR